MNIARLFIVLMGLLAGLVFGPVAATAQFLPTNTQAEATVALPDSLTPDLVDGMLARMTDAQIRGLLRDELVRRAAEDAANADGPGTYDMVEARLNTMWDRIGRRVPLWIDHVLNLGDRFGEVARRVDTAASGVFGMILAASSLIATGVISAMVIGRLTAPWRRWLKTVNRTNYWDKVVRTLALGVVEIIPIFAFLFATNAMAPMLTDDMGPLSNMLWIYTSGVSYAWIFIVILRRAFAPDAPDVRIAPLTDDAAHRVHRLLRRAVLIGVSGWLLAGLALHIGLGLRSAMVVNVLAGTTVAAVLLLAVVRSGARIRTATAQLFTNGGASAFSRIAIAVSPTLLAIYVIGAWAYWLALWLERGRHSLDGPVGTLLVYFVLPIIDRIGRELVDSAIRSHTEAAQRFREVFYGFWRMLIGLMAIIFVLWLWGFNLFSYAAQTDAPAWTAILANIAVTLLVGYLIWSLIRAALYTEKRVSDASEDVDPSEIPAATRLDTLTPLFRNVLLFILVVVILMTVMSSFGVDIGPLIASAGIIGIAVGFGAQALVRDVLSGVFFLIDDAFRVGEYIELENDMRGEVENISVRSLQLRHHRGPVITIPFGELRNITNHNRDWVIYKMMFRMEPDTDPQRLKKVVKKVGAEFMEHPVHGPKFIEPLKSQGVYYIDDDSALVIRLKFKCKPRAQFVLRRDIYHRMRVVFEEEGFKLARRKVEVVTSDGQELSAKEKAAAVPEEVLTNPPAAPV